MRKFKSSELRSEKLKLIVFYKKKENYYRHVKKIPKYNKNQKSAFLKW